MNSPTAQETITAPATIPVSTGGTLWLKVMLGGALIVIGSVFTFLLWHSYQLAEETRHWTPVPCLIVSSQVLTMRDTPNSPVSYDAHVGYRYSIDGKSHESFLIRRGTGKTTDKSKAMRIVSMYSVGKTTTCHVNPTQTDVAVLEHNTRAALYALWFPLLFVVGGTGMVISAFRK